MGTFGGVKVVANENVPKGQTIVVGGVAMVHPEDYHSMQVGKKFNASMGPSEFASSFKVKKNPKISSGEIKVNFPEFVGMDFAKVEAQVAAHMAAKIDGELTSMAAAFGEAAPKAKNFSKVLTEAVDNPSIESLNERSYEMNPLRKDTLEYQLSRPGVLHRDMSAVPLKTVIAAMIGNKQETEHPEVDGLRFYMANHAVAIMRQKFLPKEPMGDHLDVLNHYHEVLAETVPRMFHYLLKICTREMRHTYQPEAEDRLHIVATYGQAFWDFYKEIKGDGSSGAVKKLINSPPDMPIGQYVDGLHYMFYKQKFSGGYGGKAWGAVTDCLREFVHGRFSAEMMMDTAFTLCHNNGPIFNKGMEFHHYDSGEIVKILDVQRSGQIPQMVANNESSYSDNEKVVHDYARLKPRIGKKFEGHVDWFVVEALGSMKHYPSEKKVQEKEFGMSKEAEKAMKAAKAKAAAEQKAAELEAAKLEKRQYVAAPGLVLKKIKMVREVA